MFPGHLKIDHTFLHQNEKILMILRRHWIILVFKSFYLLLLILSSAFLFFIKEPIVSLVGESIFWAVINLYWIIFLVFVFVSWINDELDVFVITNGRVIGIEQVSALSRNVSECSLDMVQEVDSHLSGIFQSIFGYGEVTIHTASESSKMIVHYAPDPVENARKINTIIQEHRNSTLIQ